MSSKAISKAELPPVPYFPADKVELIKRQICPGASNDELQMFLADCERSRLDPFARQIYSVERSENYKDENGKWKSRKKRVTIVSIDGFRLIAERTGEYAGQLGPEWCGADGEWHDVWTSKTAPLAARVGVLRKDFEKPLWSPAMFDEYCPRFDGEPTGRWKTAPAGMLAKCAEALSLRRAFPRELSNFYTSDEMMHVIADAEPPNQPSSAAPALNPPTNAAAAGALTPHQEKIIALILAKANNDHEREVFRMACEAAMRGRIPLQTYFNNRPSGDKTRLRTIEPELVQLYPSDMEQ